MRVMFFTALAITSLSGAAHGQVARWAEPNESVNAPKRASNDDYPPAAMRGGDEGIATVLLTVDGSGKIGNCVVTESSGSAALDQATCRMYWRRARFSPGSPGDFIRRVEWRFPD